MGSDFLPTIMEVLGVGRPISQMNWGFDGVSILPILRGEPPSHRCLGHNFNTEGGIDKALRCGNWKLYNLETDLGERHDLSATEPGMLAVMLENDKSWSASIAKSIGSAESN